MKSITTAFVFLLGVSAFGSSFQAKNPFAKGESTFRQDITDLSPVPDGAVMEKSIPAVLDISRGFSPQEFSSPVYCSAFANGHTSGFSLFRAYDNVDLGNAVWRNDDQECRLAAKLANEMSANLVCSVFYNSNSQTIAYSAYRISDNKDLGKATISDFSTCQQAVMSARHGVFCSTYVQNNQVWWSIYDIATGQDLGTTIYGSLQACQQHY